MRFLLLGLSLLSLFGAEMAWSIPLPAFGAPTWKNTVAAVASLPATGNTIGDVRYAISEKAIYAWDGSAWNGQSGISSTLTSAHILVGNGSNVATDVACSGDVTCANTGAITIANSAVTNAKMASMSDLRFKGNVSGGSAAPSDLTVAQVNTALGTLAASTNDGNSGATATVDFSTVRNHIITLTSATVALTLSGTADGGVYVLELIQDGTGTRTVDWSGNSIKWAGGGTAPTLTTTAAGIDIVSCLRLGSTKFCAPGLNWQ